MIASLIEEEKKCDGVGSSYKAAELPFEMPPVSVVAPTVEKQDEQHLPVPKSKVFKSNNTVVSPVVGQSLRFILLDIPLLMVLLLYASAMLAEYAKENLFASLYEGLLWDDDRKSKEITYFTRICDENDISTTDPSSLFLPLNGTGADGANIMMKHGFTVIQKVVQPKNAAKLRAHIDARSKNLTEEEKIWLVKGKNRYSFNLGTEMPGMTEVLEDLGKHKQLTETLKTLLGPDPAMIEMNVITASFGAENQWYHDDAVPDGSPTRYGHAFSPAISIFVNLQDLTTDMGITSACPGTHFCSAGDLGQACDEKGFQLADENGILPVGDTFLFNMNVWHRGAAHVDPNGQDRIMLILSFVPRPKDKAETRQMVHGITYAIRWDMWGFTWRDLARARSVMVSPWNYLRAMGIYKPRGSVWGMDFITSAAMRAANENNGYTASNVVNAEVVFLPEFLRLSPNEIDDAVTNSWFWFCNDQIAKVLRVMKKATFVGLLTYMAIFVGMGLFSSQGFSSQLLRSVRRVAMLCAIAAAVGYSVRRSIDSTQWAKDLKARRLYFGVMDNEHLFDEVKDGYQALPNRNDVLIESRYGYKDLGSYSNFIDYHTGNAVFLDHVDAVAPSYSTYPALFKEMSAKYIAENVLAQSGRFLEQGQNGRWHLADMNTAVYFTKKILTKRSMGIVGTVLDETRHLLSSMRYGIYRNTDLAFFSAPFLKDLTSKFLDACIGKKPIPPSVSGIIRPPHMQPEYAEDGVTVLQWKKPVRKESEGGLIKSPSKVSLPSKNNALRVPRRSTSKFVAKEPSQGAWIMSGDWVEAKLNYHWYVGKIKQISAHGNHWIDLVDGTENYFDEYEIRRPVPFEVGQEVQVLVDDEGDEDVYDDAIIIAVEHESKMVTVKTSDDDENETVHESHLRRKVVTMVKEKPEHSYSSYK